MIDKIFTYCQQIFFGQNFNFFLCYSAEIFVDNGDVDVICVVDKDAWQIFEPVCSLNT